MIVVDEEDDGEDFRDEYGVAEGLAVVLQSVRWNREELVQAARTFVGSSKPDNCDRLIGLVLSKQPTAYPPTQQWLCEFFLNSQTFDRLIEHNLANDKADQKQLFSPAFN
ncbi:MAG: hypothetical protein AAFO75_12320, partial [Pseudomonadota bacterium]